MNIDDMVRAVRTLSETYGGHTWIDFDIVPGIAVALLEEFDHLDREAVLAALDADAPRGWEKKSSARVRKHFGPRCFVVVEKNGRRLFWNSHFRNLVDGIEGAIRFEDEDEAREVSDRECGPLGSKEPYYKDAVVTIERIEYPEWTKCENPA